MRNTYFVTCPFCGSNLDPGERCDCEGVEKYVEEQSQAVSRRDDVNRFFPSREDAEKKRKEVNQNDGSG